ncbi:MAG: PspC domain-containing protein [Jatrophihabitans sp.]
MTSTMDDTQPPQSDPPSKAPAADLPPSVSPPPPGGGSGEPGGPGRGPGSGPPRLLRRSRTDRMGVGVCGGLGAYFGVDPVIFRVLIAVLAVFGGAGILLYLLMWLAIPEEGAPTSTLDRGIAEARRRKIPFGLVAAGTVLVIWVIGFSWWAPPSLWPAIIVTAVLLFVLSRRADRTEQTAVPGPPYSPAASVGTAPLDYPSTYESTVPLSGDPERPWAVPPIEPSPSGGSQLREWMEESRSRGRERRRRTFPIRISVCALAFAAVVTLALIDWLHGIPFATYFWTIGAIVLGGLIVGAATRRAPWHYVAWLAPVAVGLIAFGSSPASLHNGWGDRAWTPHTSSAVSGQYKIAFGRGTLDLSSIRSVDAARTVKVTMGAGQVRIVIPRSLAVVVHTDIHFGTVTVEGNELHSGYNFNRDVASPAVGQDSNRVITVDATLTNGQIKIDYVG